MCLTPLTLKNPRTGKYIQVPCGHCVECLMSQQTEWTNRCVEEWKGKGRVGVFATFTYNDDNVPKNYFYKGQIYKSSPQYGIEIQGKNGAHTKYKEDPSSCLPDEAFGLPIIPFSWKVKNKEVSDEVKNALELDYPISFNSVRKEDVQLTIKRFRKNHPNLNFTYFISSEYGPQTYRPHYHCLFFGVDRFDLIDMFNEWKSYYGVQLKAEDVYDEGAFGYTAKYTCKGMFDNIFCSKDFIYFHNDGTTTEYHSKSYEKCLEFFGIDEPIVDRSFKLLSKGIGKSFLTPQKIEYFIGKSYDRLKYRIDRFARNHKYINHKNIKLKLPKYYETKLYKILKEQTGSDYCKHCIQEILLQESDQLYFSKFSLLEAEDSNRKDIEIDLELLQKEENNKVFRAQSKFHNLNKSYKNSKL